MRSQDAHFIAAARTDIPFLLEQLTKAVEVIESIEAAVDDDDMTGTEQCVLKWARDFLKEMRE